MTHTQNEVSHNDLEEILELLTAKENEVKYNKLPLAFPDDGPYRRELYPRQMDFMAAGKEYQERAIVGANRSGKTFTGARELAYHMTGLYPDWWEGRRFTNAVSCWVAGVTNEGTRSVIQKELLGDVEDVGTGALPKDKIVRFTRKPNTAGAVDTVWVRHISGDLSDCGFKAYEQGRETFQGTKKQVIWLDEEPKDRGIYSECLTRLMDKFNPGLIYLTFTPLFGLSDTVLSFMPNGLFPRGGVNPKNPQKYVVNVGWDNVPHLGEQEKANLLASYAPHERDARSKGIPGLGSGAIFPYPQDEYVISPLEIEPWWPRAYGLDVGWNVTAAVWGAIDPMSGTVYIYSEHYTGGVIPAIHASAIKQRGKWIPGVVDPASQGSSQSDGSVMLELYRNEDLNLTVAENAVTSGIASVAQYLETGMLKIFSNCTNLIGEMRIYSRDEKGKIIKKNDHAVDALRYLITSGLNIADTLPDPDAVDSSSDNFADRDEFTGY